MTFEVWGCEDSGRLIQTWPSQIPKSTGFWHWADSYSEKKWRYPRTDAMRVLTITTLYPSALAPTHGVFVENRLRQLVKTDRLTATVVAPVPWFPFRSRVFGRYGMVAGIPPIEARHGLQVHHPRYALIPKVGMSLAPFFLYLSLRRHVRKVLKNAEGFDLIDAHYVYPDGVAAAWLGAVLGKPVVVTARGSDLHLIAKYWIPRLLIKHSLKLCSAVVAVSQALANSARAVGGPDLPIEFSGMVSTWIYFGKPIVNGYAAI